MTPSLDPMTHLFAFIGLHNQFVGFHEPSVGLMTHPLAFATHSFAFVPFEVNTCPSVPPFYLPTLDIHTKPQRAPQPSKSADMQVLYPNLYSLINLLFFFPVWNVSFSTTPSPWAPRAEKEALVEHQKYFSGGRCEKNYLDNHGLTKMASWHGSRRGVCTHLHVPGSHPYLLIPLLTVSFALFFPRGTPSKLP